jgi:hypothetical protein
VELTNQLKELASKIKSLKDQIETEEATKTAFVLPFINALGYDIFNPTEVIPEYTADLGLKKGEKVDYAIIKDKQPILIIECKHWREDLTTHNSQLFRYFHVSKSKFALLTNGIEYKFYTDLDASNKMDEKPFLEFSITNLKDAVIAEIQKFHKSTFDIDKIVTNASSLKYVKEIRKVFDQQLANPENDFIRFFTSRVYSGRQTEKVLEQFRSLVTKSLHQFISDRVNERLQNALNSEENSREEASVKEEISESKIVTTEEELEGFRILIAILRKRIPVSRIAYRDTQSYFGVLLDDNNRKPICRLHFNGKKKYLGVFDASKKETKYVLENLEAIYDYDTEILKTVAYYEEGKEVPVS